MFMAYDSLSMNEIKLNYDSLNMNDVVDKHVREFLLLAFWIYD